MPLRLRQAIAGRPTATSRQNLDVLTVGDSGFFVRSVQISVQSPVELMPSIGVSVSLEYRSSGS